MARERKEHERQEFKETIKKVFAKRFKFYDEAGFHKALVRLYGWAEKGDICQQSVPANRGKNQTLLGGLGWEGMVAHHLQEGSLTKADVPAFLTDKVVPHLNRGDILVLDNAGNHDKEAIQTLLREKGCSAC